MHIGYISIHQTAYLSGGVFQKNNRKFILYREKYLEIFKIQTLSGKIISSLVLNFFFNFLFQSLFTIKNTRKNYLFFLDEAGHATVIQIFDSGNLIRVDLVDLKKILKIKQFSCFQVGLDKKNLTFLICNNYIYKFICRIKQNFELVPFISNKLLIIKHYYIICYYITCITSHFTYTSNFVSIETIYNRPYDKFLVFYYINFSSKCIKRNIVCKINDSSYILLPFPATNKCQECILILCENFFVFINLYTLSFLFKDIPFRKIRKKYRSNTYITSFGYFKSRNKMIYIMTNQNGDLLGFVFSYKFNDFYLKFNWKIQYIHSFYDKIHDIFILSNGFIFLSIKTGNHIYLQFLKFNIRENKSIKTYFYPRYYFKYILVIQEFLNNVYLVSAFILGNFLKIKQSKILLLCKNKIKSSIRLLSYSCFLKHIFHKEIKRLPDGINKIEFEKNSIIILISFKFHTDIYILFKKLGQINFHCLVTDFPSIFSEYVISKKGILQCTNKSLRFIKIYKNKKNISECKFYGDRIKNCIILEECILRVLIILDEKGFLLEILEDGSFVELEILTLKSLQNIHLFGNSVNDKKLNWNMLILFEKKQKAIRFYSLNKFYFMKLIGIQILPWSPNSAKLILKNKKLVILVGLNNGNLAKIILNSVMVVKNQKTVKISISPLYVLKENFFSYTILFGSKLWLLKHAKNYQNFFLKPLINDVDLAECSSNLIMTFKDKKLIIWKLQKKKMVISNYVTVDFLSNFTDMTMIQTFQRNWLVSFFCVQPDFRTPNNFIQLEYNYLFVANFFFTCKKMREYNMFVISLFSKTLHYHYFYDFLICKKFFFGKALNNVFLYKLCKTIYVELISCSFLSYFDKNFIQLNKINEMYKKAFFLLCFRIMKKLKYIKKKGGKIFFQDKMVFVFKTLFYLKKTSGNPLYIFKNLFKKRLVLFNNKIIIIAEIKLNKIQIIFQINSLFLHLIDIDIYKNKFLTIDIIEGFKIFNLKSDFQRFMLFAKIIHFNFLTCGKFLDMITFIISDKLGNVCFFRIKQNNYTALKTSSTLYFTRKFCLITRLHLTSPVRKILVFHLHIKKKTAWICLICANSQFFFIKPILMQHKILFLAKFFYNINRAYDVVYKKKFTINTNFVFDNSVGSVNLETLIILNTLSK
nr:splicing factor 3b subunit 3 [Cryptomonas paramecium]